VRLHRQRLLLLIVTMAAIAVTVTAVAVIVLYRSNLETQERRLEDLVAYRASLIEAIFRATGDPLMILEQLADAERHAPGIGMTGEFTIARRDGGDLVFLTPLRNSKSNSGSGVLRITDAGRAEPMRRALAGERGTLIGRDYQGEDVLAAYRPVAGLGWGLVAKIDLAEVRAPFLRAATLALLGAGLLVALGAVIFTRVTSPMILLIEDSERRLRTKFDQAAVGMAEVGLDGTWLRVNQRLCDIVGYSSSELSRLTLRDVTHPEDLEHDLEMVAKLLAGEIATYNLEQRYLRKDGGIVWINLTVSLVRGSSGEPDFCIAIIEDISQRKLFEIELAESRAMLQTVVETLPQRIFWKDPEGRYLGCNQPFAADGGLTSPAEIIGRDDHELAWAEVADAYRADDRAVIKSGVAKLDFEEPQIDREGRRTWLRTSKVPLRGPDGQIFGLLGTYEDITARKAVEDEVHRHREHLEELVEARSADLEQTIAQLKAVNEELESFSYTVSHDLRAPLRAIDGFVRILVEDHGAALSPEAQRCVQTVRDNAKNMGLLIDDLLSFSKLSREELRVGPVELDEVVEEAWIALAADYEGRRVEFVRGDLPQVVGDPRLLKLVFANLLGNAVKYTRPREVARIEVGCRRLNGDTAVFVSDNGVGFDMRYKDKLFGVFQRLHRADDFEGTGIGLATVQRIVNRHRGRIWAEAEIDLGATFFMTFSGGSDASGQSG